MQIRATRLTAISQASQQAWLRYAISLGEQYITLGDQPITLV